MSFAAQFQAEARKSQDDAAHVTPHAEAFQAVIRHLFASPPALKTTRTKWESLP